MMETPATLDDWESDMDALDLEQAKVRAQAGAPALDLRDQLDEKTLLIGQRVGKMARALLKSSEQVALGSSDRDAAKESTDALIKCLTLTHNFITNLQTIAKSPTWVSNDVQKLVVELAEMMSLAASDLTALSKVEADGKFFDVKYKLDRSVTILDQLKPVLDLMHNIRTVESGFNNLGLSVKEFKGVLGKEKPFLADQGPSPAQMSSFGQELDKPTNRNES